ncbi:uncharacterized protein P884DRAFT_308334 [Thermothelomyces heterothallicus CBS 202.75]|uniref:uncharacterized protein n=1 Tax=Thermothelomyces heterothallicus CBS 202.75 TaxID=1149848 RepID=UPI003742C732
MALEDITIYMVFSINFSIQAKQCILETVSEQRQLLFLMATDPFTHLSFREDHIATASPETTSSNRATTAGPSPSLSPDPFGHQTEVQRGRKRHRTIRDIKVTTTAAATTTAATTTAATTTATTTTKHRPRPCPGSTDSRTLRGRARNRSTSVISTTTATTTTSTPSPALAHAQSLSHPDANLAAEQHHHRHQHQQVPHCHHDHHDEQQQQQHALSEGLMTSNLGVVVVRDERWQDSPQGNWQRQKERKREREREKERERKTAKRKQQQQQQWWWEEEEEEEEEEEKTEDDESEPGAPGPGYLRLFTGEGCTGSVLMGVGVSVGAVPRLSLVSGVGS